MTSTTPTARPPKMPRRSGIVHDAHGHREALQWHRFAGLNQTCPSAMELQPTDLGMAWCLWGNACPPRCKNVLQGVGGRSTEGGGRVQSRVDKRGEQYSKTSFLVAPNCLQCQAIHHFYEMVTIVIIFGKRPNRMPNA
jgi:hypothetical protein